MVKADGKVALKQLNSEIAQESSPLMTKQQSDISEVPSLTSNIDNDCVRRFRTTFLDKNNMAYSVIMALNLVVQGSREKLVSAMYEEIERCSQLLLTTIKDDPDLGDRTLLPIRALLKIFMRIVMSVSTEESEIEKVRNNIHLKGISFAEHI